MRRNRIIYIFLLIAAAIFAGAYQSKLTFVMLITLAALPAATLLLLIAERFALKLEVNPNNLFVQKLRKFSITVTIRNRFIIPMSPVRVTGVFQDEDGNLINDKTMIVSVMPLCKTELLFGGCLKYRGEYHLGVCEAAIYDLLGLFCIKVKITPSCDVVVAPRRLSLERTGSLCADDYDSAQTKMSFFESNSFSSVREYTDGETLRYVHWKLSAKQDTLMVKQTEQNLGANSVIITDMTAFSDSDEENIRAADAAAEVSLAITGKIISEGRSAVNLFRSGAEDTELFPAESAEDYERLYCIFSVIPITENDGIEKLVNKMRESAVSSETVFISAPRVDADDMRRFLGGGLSGCKRIQVFLTGGEPDAGLISLAETDTRLVLSEIDPEDIALSIRNILSDK